MSLWIATHKKHQKIIKYIRPLSIILLESGQLEQQKGGKIQVECQKKTGVCQAIDSSHDHYRM